MRAIFLAAWGAAVLGASAAAGAEPAPAPAASTPAPAPAPGYGPPVTLDEAKRIVAAAEAEARRQGFSMAFAVVEPSGALVAFEKMDGTQYGSIDVAQAKARTAALYRRPSKAFGDGLSAGRLGILSFEGVVAVEGGVPILRDGRIVGAIGASGGSSDQDGQVAAAGAASIRR
jgi:uncharacterized protein GlcG (DUF336 family)